VSTIVKSVARVVAAVIMVVSAGLLVTAGTANAQTPSPKSITPFAGAFHTITNAGHSGMCLQPVTPDFRSLIVQRPCDGSQAQLWASLFTGTNHYRFLNTSGWCMSVDSPASGSAVLQDECEAPGQTTVSNAEWNSGASLPNVVTLRTRFRFVDNNTCLDEPGASGGNVNMQLFTCNGTLAQRWVVGF
jgi:hypothetical protein